MSLSPNDEIAAPIADRATGYLYELGTTATHPPILERADCVSDKLRRSILIDQAIEKVRVVR
jgi:hypothetical protein